MRAPVRVDATILDTLAELVPLAPLHQPHNLLPIRVIAREASRHRRRSLASTPRSTGQHRRWRRRSRCPHRSPIAGVRRYGFHGLSYEYIASVLPQHDAHAAAGQTVVLHLGNGASMCAMLRRPQHHEHDGLHGRRRPADGHAHRHPRPGRASLSHAGAQDGRRGDREAALQSIGTARRVGQFERHARAPRGTEPRAKLAVDLFVYRIGRELGSLAAALGGLDAIVFTAGIGENSAAIREARVPRGGMARRRTRRRRECRRRSSHQHRVDAASRRG